MENLETIIKRQEDKLQYEVMEDYIMDAEGMLPGEAKNQYMREHFEKLKLWHTSSIKEILEGIVEREKGMKQEKSEKCSNCGGKGQTLQCIGGSDWAIKDSYNKAKQDTINYLEEVIKKL